MSEKIRPVLNLFSEAGLLKRVQRSGWWVVGMKNPETVAEHCFRCAVIGYALAHLENADPYQVMTMCLFNDIHEARINDAHKVAVRYLDYTQAEDRAFSEQIASLPQGMKKELGNFRKDYSGQKTKESILARDADILECLLQAKEYYESGNPQAKLFFKKAPQHLKSKTAKMFWKTAKDMDATQWWQKLCEFKR